MGQESIAFAAVSALLCSDADELACLDVGAYNKFKHSVNKPEGHYMIWALASMARQGCTTPERPCAGDAGAYILVALNSVHAYIYDWLVLSLIISMLAVRVLEGVERVC